MFRRAVPFVGVAAVAAAVVIAVAALTTWWVLLALIPLMMVGCMAMMAAMPSMMDAWQRESWGPGMMGFDGWLGPRAPVRRGRDLRGGLPRAARDDRRRSSPSGSGWRG